MSLDGPRVKRVLYRGYMEEEVEVTSLEQLVEIVAHEVFGVIVDDDPFDPSIVLVKSWDKYPDG